MRKLLLCLTALLTLSLTAYAGKTDIKRASAHHACLKTTLKAKVPALTLKTPGATISRAATTAPDYAPHEWEEWGEGYYYDDILTASMFLSYTEPVLFKVRVQRDKANEGIYRIIDPWRNYPYHDRVEAEEDTDAHLNLGDDYYITIDARDPEYVRVLRSPLGLEDWGGPTEIIGISECYGLDEEITEEEAEGAGGKMADGVITFPVECSLGIIQYDEDIQGDYVYYANESGLFALYLPGTPAPELPIDYDFDIYSIEPFCPDDNNFYHVTSEGDSRIPALAYVILDEEPTEMTDEILANCTEIAVGDTIAVDMAGAAVARYVLMWASDAQGEMQQAYYVELLVPDSDADEWKYLGKVPVTEGFLSCNLPDMFTSDTFMCDIEENIYLKGYYRLKNAYATWPQSAPYALKHSHNHYIYINAYDPDNVYVEHNTLGISLPAYGEFIVSSDYYANVEEYGRDIVSMLGLTSGGTLTDGVISFNYRHDTRLLAYNLGKWFDTNRIDNPEYDEEAAKEQGDAYEVPPTTGGHFKIDLNKLESGIEAVEAVSDAGAEYFNLQGIRVERPANGLFIRRQGGKSEKIFIK